jgi:hypothetical protein
MPSYEIRYLNDEGELALIHKMHHENDDAVDRAAFRMLLGSGLADYEIWRDDNAPFANEHDARKRMLKTTLRVV